MNIDELNDWIGGADLNFSGGGALPVGVIVNDSSEGGGDADLTGTSMATAFESRSAATGPRPSQGQSRGVISRASAPRSVAAGAAPGGRVVTNIASAGAGSSRTPGSGGFGQAPTSGGRTTTTQQSQPRPMGPGQITSSGTRANPAQALGRAVTIPQGLSQSGGLATSQGGTITASGRTVIQQNVNTNPAPGNHGGGIVPIFWDDALIPGQSSGGGGGGGTAAETARTEPAPAETETNTEIPAAKNSGPSPIIPIGIAAALFLIITLK